MKTNERVDEALEAIWTCTEYGRATVSEVRMTAVGGATAELLESMRHDGLITIDGAGDDAKVKLTGDGLGIGRRIIRSHRLAERLVCDVLGLSLDSAEAAACEFEHTLSGDITDSICTLLGHPRLCPHGKEIPEGECCRQERDEVGPVVLPATA